MVVQVKFWADVDRWGASERFGCHASISLECVFCSLAFGGLFCYLRMLRVPQLKNSSKMRLLSNFKFRRTELYVVS